MSDDDNVLRTMYRLRDELQELNAERDRYRKALEEIRDWSPETLSSYEGEIARAALEGKP